MALQYSVAVRDARLDAVEATISADPILHIRTGAAPANCAAASSGTLLCEITLPSDWMAAASGGSKALSGTWSGIGVANGAVGHFRIFESGGATCHVQGSASGPGDGGDLEVSDDNIAISDTVDVTAFTLTGGNG